MIAALRGYIFKLSPNIIQLEVNDVIYKILISLNTFENFQKMTTKDKLIIYTRYIQKDGPPTLYGFSSTEEADFFDFLIGLTGIGANSALQIISHYEVDELETIFINKDIKSLKKIPGIGDRKAKQMILDSEPRLEKWSNLKVNEKVNKESNLTVLENALSQLGYSRSEISKSMDKVEDLQSLSALPINEQIKYMLKLL